MEGYRFSEVNAHNMTTEDIHITKIEKIEFNKGVSR